MLCQILGFARARTGSFFWQTLSTLFAVAAGWLAGDWRTQGISTGRDFQAGCCVQGSRYGRTGLFVGSVVVASPLYTNLP